MKTAITTPKFRHRPGASVLLVLLVLLVLHFCASAAPLRMATEAYVTNALATATNAAQTAAITAANANTTAATNALSAALSAAIPTNNAQLANGAGYVTAAITNGLQLTETDPTVPEWAKAPSAPLPPNYATVSNKAMTALQSFTETDPRFTAWADTQTDADGVVYYSQGSGWAYKLKSIFSGEDLYSAEDITAISNGFAAADLSLSSLVSLSSLAATNYTDSAISAAIAPANPTFSNAVLSVGLGIDTNAVAVLNEIAADFGGFPLSPGSTATTVGGLLAALAAAIAWLKKNKADVTALRYSIPTAITASATLTDRAINNVTCGSAAIALTLPAATSGYARDLLIRVDRVTNTGNAGVTFPATDAGSAAVSYETDDGSMPAVDDAAVTLLSFTEVSAGRFLVAAKQVQEVA